MIKEEYSINRVGHSENRSPSYRITQGRGKENIYLEELKSEAVHKELTSFRVYDDNEASLLKTFRKYPSYMEDARGETLLITMPYADDINSLAFSLSSVIIAEQ